MNIEELFKSLKTLEDHAARDQAVKMTLDTLGTAVGEILEHLESNAPKMADAIAKALKDLRIEAAAPQVNVEFKAPPAAARDASKKLKFTMTPKRDQHDNVLSWTLEQV